MNKVLFTLLYSAVLIRLKQHGEDYCTLTLNDSVTEEKIMKKILSTLILVFAGASTQSQAAPEIISLYPEDVKKVSLDEISTSPEGEVPRGPQNQPQKHWTKTLHTGEVSVALYESTPALVEIKEPFPYDEYVHVLEGEVTLTHIDGKKQTFTAGDSFLVPKGFLGTWNMTKHFRELVVVETKSMMKAEGL